MAKLCPCPGRKCGCLATPHIIKTMNNHVGTSTLLEMQDWCIQRFKWREQQAYEYGKGVKPHNVEQMIKDVRNCKTKGALLNLLENKAIAYHETIKENKNKIEYFGVDEKHYDYDYCADFDCDATEADIY